ncbi:unnamed protein product [Ostreobium quekettii]|uniref:Uncharacterized protein n=1 Tax=Ostreobium quekettii TaxID=121088 RepID=A0A8S1ILE1_9CHLO|nr:unnamed protein product [Ostreobium quekettii]|eukprot:evm.model.scf_70EXC.8 EVM.evm.TU.scf_70EXC.8   scf_70EXC:134107-139823(-)
MQDAEDVKDDDLAQLSGRSQFTKGECMLCITWISGQLLKGLKGHEGFKNKDDTVSVGRVLETLESERAKAITACERLLSPTEPAAGVQELSSQYYSLEFTHDCCAWGCLNPRCDLCEKNPRRRCSIPFEKKYFKGDPVKAKCGASIALELIDTASSKVAESADATLELFIVDGNKYDQTFPDGVQRGQDEALNACALLTGNENRQLLVSTDKSANHPDGKVLIALQGGRATLPEIIVTQSSEALLSGRRPPFRLVATLSKESVSISPQQTVPAVSLGFVVASGRSRLAQKKCIPSMDDPLSKLEHMGKERVRKLKDLQIASAQLHLSLPSSLPEEITKVGHFKSLVLQADKDGHLKQRLLHVLKMSDKAWDEARDHALAAVANDTRMRAWYKNDASDQTDKDGNLGLVFVCHLGETDMERPVALIRNNDVINKDRQGPRERELVGQLQAEALAAWRRDNHPGWTFYPFDSEDYAQDPSSLPPPGAAQHPSFRRPGRQQMSGLSSRELWLQPRDSAIAHTPEWYPYSRGDFSSVRSSGESWESVENTKKRKLQGGPHVQDAPEARLPPMPPPAGFGPENANKPANVQREFDRLRSSTPKRGHGAMVKARDCISLPVHGLPGLQELQGHLMSAMERRQHASATPWVGVEGSVNHGSSRRDQGSEGPARLLTGPDAEFYQHRIASTGQFLSHLQPLLAACSQPAPSQGSPSSMASTGRHISVQSSIHGSVQSNVHQQGSSAAAPMSGVELSGEERLAAGSDPMVVDQRPEGEPCSRGHNRREGALAATSLPVLALADVSQGLAASEQGARSPAAGMDLSGAGMASGLQQQVVLVPGNNWEPGSSVAPYNVYYVTMPIGQGNLDHRMVDSAGNQEDTGPPRPLSNEPGAKEG